MAMGSVLGPTMAAFAMDMLESTFDNYVGNSPLFYRRYVDDCLALFTSHEDAYNFLNYLNSLHPSLKFTIEHEQADGSINFLDTRISHDEDGHIAVEWTLKDTNTGSWCTKIPIPVVLMLL